MIVINALFKAYIILPKSTKQKLVDLFYAIKTKRINPKGHQKSIYPYSRQHWALENISVNVKSNSILGVIGLNGSGKSTLLRILSGHLSSSSGYISCSPADIQLVDESSVSLENDLTVKSSILNSITDFKGQERQDILFKIVSYFDLADKQEHTIGSLSLGTRARLSFALATLSVKPILLIDEILGAGDPFWLDRCYYWLKNFCLTNKTVLMTSHDTQLLQKFCNEAIWIDNGAIREYDLVENVAAKYEAYAYSLSFQGHSLDRQEIYPALSSVDNKNSDSSLKIRSNNRISILQCIIQTPNQHFTLNVDDLKDEAFEINEKINSFSVEILCNQPGIYWPTALVTIWSNNGWRLATFQNKSLELDLKINQVISIDYEQLNIPDLPNNLFISVSLFSTKNMLTSIEEIAREDYWHKFIKQPYFAPSLEDNTDSSLHKCQSPFIQDQIIDTLFIP